MDEQEIKNRLKKASNYLRIRFKEEFESKGYITLAEINEEFENVLGISNYVPWSEEIGIDESFFE